MKSLPTSRLTALLFYAMIVLLINTANAQEEPRKISTGDTIQFDDRGTTRSGIVVGNKHRDDFRILFTRPGDITGNENSRFLERADITFLASAGARRIDSSFGIHRRHGLFNRNFRPYRTWNAASGDFDLTARYVYGSETSVVLEKEDGTHVTVELSSLCEADNQHVAVSNMNNLIRKKITAKPIIPFADKRHDLKPGAWNFPETSGESTNFSLPSTKVQLIRPIGFGSSVRGRHFFFRSDDNEFDTTNRPIETLSSFKDLSLRFTHWVMAQDGKRCFLIATSDFDPVSLIQGMNFETGKLEQSELIDGYVIAISTDGKIVAFIQQPWSPNLRGEMIIKEVGESGSVLKRFPIKARWKDFGYAPSAGYFLNDSILATAGSRIVAMDLNRNTGYSTTPFPKKLPVSRTAISPNRRFLAILSRAGIYVYDVSMGKPIGMIKTENSHGEVVFSPDGKKIAICSRHQGIRTYDLSTGKLIKTLETDRNYLVDEVSWPHPRFLMLGHRALFDIELGVVVWNFKTTGSFFDPMFYMGGSTYMLNDGHGGLTPVDLNFDEIAREAEQVELDDATVLNEGDDYRIEYDVPFGPGEIGAIHASITKQMEDKGLIYHEESDNVFACTVTEEEEQTAEIRVVRNTDYTVTVKYTPTVSKVQLIVGGSLKWQFMRSNTIAGSSVTGQKNETPQRAVTRICRAKANDFISVRFPTRFILFPNGTNLLGKSKITPDGLVDMK